jgi:hypothetical protein
MAPTIWQVTVRPSLSVVTVMPPTCRVVAVVPSLKVVVFWLPVRWVVAVEPSLKSVTVWFPCRLVRAVEPSLKVVVRWSPIWAEAELPFGPPHWVNGPTFWQSDCACAAEATPAASTKAPHNSFMPPSGFASPIRT